MPYLKSKEALIHLGARLNKVAITWPPKVARYLAIGKWLSGRHLECGKRQLRQEVWADMLNRIGQDVVLYLEFGVFEGAATRWWSQHLINPKSILHGFDSFEGLPENWHGHARAGHFGVGGKVPLIADPRVKFYKGWFNETLPGYEVPGYERLVINMDADLYSSTKFVLNCLNSHLRPGTLIYFDEFNDVEHELKAFDEFLAENKLDIRLVSSNRWMQAVAFELV